MDIKTKIKLIAIGILVVLVGGMLMLSSLGGGEEANTSTSGTSPGASNAESYTSVFGTSISYDNSLTKEEFIEYVEAYNPGHIQASTGRYKDECYQAYFIDYAEDYFDISIEYGYDPRAIFCTGIQESDFGTSDIANDKCNFWGLGAVDGDAYNAAITFGSIPEGIEYLCSMLDDYTKNTESWKYQKIIENGYDPTTIEGVGSLYASDGTWASQKKTHMKNIFGWEEYNSSFLQVAKTLWKEVCNRFTTYGGTSIVPSGTTIDCSSYVSWVLYEYGYEEFEGVQHNTSDFYSIDWKASHGWTVIDVLAGEDPTNKVQPGDLFVRVGNNGFGHIMIVERVENGKVYGYDCGDAENWKKSGNTHMVEWEPGWAREESWFFTDDNRKGKIIRVTAP